MSCELFRSDEAGRTKVCSALTFSETSFFLRIRSGGGPFHANFFDRGTRFEDFQAAFPPELLTITGPVQNLTAFVHDGVYIMALNYGRPVTATDALFLKGMALPGRFLSAVATDVRDVSESFLVMARALALATDSQNDNGAHVRRMNDYAVAIGREMFLPDRLLRSLSYSAQLHDVGKIYLHPDLLEKPLRLTPHEFDLVKKHPMLGAKILGDSPLLRVAKNIALTHHESWDGSGYPAGLAGEAIPVEGAIVKVADVYDALRTIHSYKSSYTHDDTCRFILDGGGDAIHEVRPCQFHPDVLRAFRKVAGLCEEIYQSE
jgi:HD-GYP domain-containing protein (c-di-GMP phosphodiesterase class II)